LYAASTVPDGIVTCAIEIERSLFKKKRSDIRKCKHAKSSESFHSFFLLGFFWLGISEAFSVYTNLFEARSEANKDSQFARNHG
jgi:hypothetical protein